MSGRYTTPGPWTTRALTQVRDTEGNKYGAVSIEVGPLIDSRGGYRYEQGAERVIVTGPAGRPRSKTFKGEMAWCQAESYYHDAAQALERMMIQTAHAVR